MMVIPCRLFYLLARRLATAGVLQIRTQDERIPARLTCVLTSGAPCVILLPCSPLADPPPQHRRGPVMTAKTAAGAEIVAEIAAVTGGRNNA